MRRCVLPPMVLSQVLMGLYILHRSTTPGVGPSTGDKDHGLFGFQLAAWSVCLISITCQVLGQVSLAPTNNPALFVGNVLGFCLFPIYLDGETRRSPIGPSLTMGWGAFAPSSVQRGLDYLSMHAYPWQGDYVLQIWRG